MNNNYKRLPERWSQFLLEKPETGMDYHIVDIYLKDGRIINNVAIISCNIIGEIKGDNGDIKFNGEDIVDIKVTHNKWKFRR